MTKLQVEAAALSCFRSWFAWLSLRVEGGYGRGHRGRAGLHFGKVRFFLCSLTLPGFLFAVRKQENLFEPNMAGVFAGLQVCVLSLCLVLSLDVAQRPSLGLESSGLE